MKETRLKSMGRSAVLLPVVVLALLFGAPAHAADESQTCSDDVLQTVADWAGIKGQSRTDWQTHTFGIVDASACKAMPDAPDTLMVVVAFDDQPGKPLDDDRHWTQVIALLDQRSGRIVAANRSTVDEDAETAVNSDSYRIDTARYRLSPTVRAFGVVFSSANHGASCVDANAGTELTLYVRDGRKLKAVMGTNLFGDVGMDYPICRADHDPDAKAPESAEIVVGVEKTVTHGFADLSLVALDYDSRRVLARTVLKYDGKSYGFDYFNGFWYPPDALKYTNK